jgi:hypothetical protein
MFVKYIRDPVHGYIGMTDVERRVIDTGPVQRLRGIKQLSIAHLVYPGGDHSRFSHGMGTMHVAGQIADALKRSVDISEDEWQLVRLAALLHDVGHGPFSHSSEEILVKYRRLDHEKLGKQVVMKSQLADRLKDCGFRPEEVVELAFGKGRRGERHLRQIVASQVDADKLDFLVRDSYHTGVEYGRIDISRIVQAMDVYRGDIAIDLKALYALEAFMIARYEMFLAVYYHHAVRAAEILLHRAMDCARELIGLTTFRDVDEYLMMDDAYVMTKLRELEPKDLEGEKEKEQAQMAKLSVDLLDSRKLPKLAYERDVYIHDPYVAKLLTDDEVRHQKEMEIAELADVSPEDVMVDVPTLDSIPYYPREIDPMEVPVFKLTSGGRKEPVKLSQYSRLINVLKGYIDIIRVYTMPEHRAKVERAAAEVFKTLPFAAQISM